MSTQVDSLLKRAVKLSDNELSLLISKLSIMLDDRRQTTFEKDKNGKVVIKRGDKIIGMQG